MSNLGYLLTKENLCKITECVATGIGLAIPIVAFLSGNKKRVVSSNYSTLDTDNIALYDAVLSKILSSNIAEYRKMDLVEMLKKDQDKSYYRNVVTILNSNIAEYRKMELIEKMNKE